MTSNLVKTKQNLKFNFPIVLIFPETRKQNKAEGLAQ